MTCGATVIDLAIRDISLSGIGLESGGTTAFSIGQRCFVGLPQHGRIDAMVINVRTQSLHLQFLETDADEVRAFIEAHVGAL